MQIHFVSLGCDKNLVDSEIMLGIIDNAGHNITYNEKDADIIVINTCGFISDANNEGIETILKMADYKKVGKCKSLIVTGCMVQRYKEEIFKELPEVDAIVGVGDFHGIGNIIENAYKGAKISLVTNNNGSIDEIYNQKRILSTPSYFAYIKIAEGCDNLCTYCTIPSIRGKYRSRKLENILNEAKTLSKNGVKEIILVAQDTSLYGIDIYDKPQLPFLLKELSKIEDIEWIRILYCYPEHLTDEIIDEMSSNKKVCHYLDMPIQHCEDRILKKMRRNGSKKKLLEKISKLRKKMPDISLRTTLIAGFPGETLNDFENLYDFVLKIKFDRLGVFEYSMEEGTPAAKMKEQIDEREKSRRKDEIMLLQKEISTKKCEEHIGKKLRVIVDGKLFEKDMYSGRSYMDCYDIDGIVLFSCSDELYSGDFVNILITDSLEYDLIGEIFYDNEFSK